MPQMEQNEFKFPDEQEKPEVKAKEAPEVEIEIEDDTPPEDRGKTPMPKPIVEELEKDELEQYDDSVKEKLKQMRKVWHDERRDKEAALREQQAAIALAQQVLQENQKFKNILSVGEREYVHSVKTAAELQLEMAKKAYKEAYDAGDSDKIIEAQQSMQSANLRLMQAQQYQPSLQPENFQVQQTQQYQPPPQPVKADARAEAWQDRNPWFGQDEEMTAAALGLHEKLRRNGTVVGSDEYYAALDKTIRRRFPEAFDGEEQQSRDTSRSRPTTVVAPATRSTAPQKVRLKTSQLALIKKLGITPEQYVKEYMKEARNG